MDKLMHEIRVIETDDGFRIEIKGDKEKMKSFLSDMKKHKHMAHAGRFPFPPWMAWKAAHCHGHGPWDFEYEQEPPAEKPQA